MRFSEFGFDSSLIKLLEERGIHKPTSIQEQAIPLIAAGKNVLFSSATGTGKTFAYLLPLLEKLSREYPSQEDGRGPLFAVLAPTYELCSQIKSEIDFLLKNYSGLRSSLLIGSANISRQVEGLKKDKPAIIAGNPGRILLLANARKLSLRNLRFLVLDEGDRLTQGELIGETGEFFEALGRAQKNARAGGALQIVSCSATIPPESRAALVAFFNAEAENGCSEPVFLELGDTDVLREKIEHWAIFSESRKKISTLRSFLAAAKPAKALVFTGNAEKSEQAASQLQYHHIDARALYAAMDKKPRKQAISAFRGGKLSVLVSSDLAARGLDIPDITHIIALDCPPDQGAYIHRAGRTARAGSRGIMVTIGDEREMETLSRLEKRLGIVVYPKVLAYGRITAP